MNFGDRVTRPAGVGNAPDEAAASPQFGDCGKLIIVSGERNDEFRQCVFGGDAASFAGSEISNEACEHHAQFLRFAGASVVIGDAVGKEYRDAG